MGESSPPPILTEDRVTSSHWVVLREKWRTLSLMSHTRALVSSTEMMAMSGPTMNCEYFGLRCRWKARYFSAISPSSSRTVPLRVSEKRDLRALAPLLDAKEAALSEEPFYFKEPDKYQEATTRALEAQRHVLGEEHEHTLGSKTALATLLDETGREGEAADAGRAAGRALTSAASRSS